MKTSADWWPLVAVAVLVSCSGNSRIEYPQASLPSSAGLPGQSTTASGIPIVSFSGDDRPLPAPSSSTTVVTATSTSTTAPVTTTTSEPPRPPEPIEVEFAGDVLFNTGESEPRPGAKRNIAFGLEQSSNVTLTDLRACSLSTARVIGHTDSRGTDDYNFELSQQRAHSIGILIEELLSLPTEAVERIGRGETELKNADIDASGRFIPDVGAMNRRVVVELNLRCEEDR